MESPHVDLNALLLLALPLVSAGLWLAIGVWPFFRYRFGSPFQRSLVAAALLLGLYALIDWFFLQLKDSGLAVLLSEVRASVFTVAVLLLFLAAKWLRYGHARYDLILIAPGLASLVVVWGGMTQDAELLDFPRLVRNTTLYAGWAGIQMAYIVGSVAMTLAIYLARKEMPSRLRRRMVASAASLLAILAAWSATNVVNNLAQSPGIPWFSSLLIIPAAIVIAAFLPLSPEEIGEVYRAVSDVNRRVLALYVFYKSGEPLAAVASDRRFPIEAEQLQGILDLVGNFVETSMRQFRGYSVTAMRFDRLGIVAVRGQYIIVAAVYEGPAYDAIRSELLRGVQTFEARRWQGLRTWEGATSIAEEVADDLARLLKKPEPSPSEIRTTDVGGS